MTPTLWFDAEHSHAAAGVVLLTPDGRAVLQLRDDIPTIDNPGRITPFGGAAERHETPRECAVRELAEETGLRAEPAALRFLGEASKPDSRGNRTACVYFILAGIDPATLRVTEGRPVVMAIDDARNDPRPTAFCKALMAKIRR
jgi:8-oxo-dGTP pyrophosphatase MutT (NUDIX family)